MKVETIELTTAKVEIAKLSCTKDDVVLFFAPQEWAADQCKDFGSWLARSNVLPTGCKFAVLPFGLQVQVINGVQLYEALSTRKA